MTGLEKRGESPAPRKPEREASESGFHPRWGTAPSEVRGGPLRTEAKAPGTTSPVVWTRCFGISEGGVPSSGQAKHSLAKRSRMEHRNVIPPVGSRTTCSGSNQSGRQGGPALRRKPAKPAMPWQTVVQTTRCETAGERLPRKRDADRIEETLTHLAKWGRHRQRYGFILQAEGENGISAGNAVDIQETPAGSGLRRNRSPKDP